MANATIFQQYLQPQRGVSDYLADYDRQDLARLQLAGQQRQNALASLMYGQQVKDAQAKADESNALRRIASGWGADTTDDQRIASLRSAGMPGLMDRADALEKQSLERQKAKASVGKDQAETLKQQLESLKFLAGGVMANPTPENAAGALAMWERLTGQQASEDRAALAQLTTPEQIKQWAASKALTADKLLPQVQIRNTGGTTDTLAIDPLTGKPAVTSSIRNTQSPDSAASVAATIRGQDVSAATAAAGRAQSERHFQATQSNAGQQYDADRGVIVNTRTGEARPVTSGGQPLGAKDKPAPEAYSKGMSGINELTGALDNYERELKAAGGPDAMATGAKRAKLQAAFTAVQMGLKNAMELGALAGPDVAILSGMLVDPTSMKAGVLLNNDGLSEQIAQTRNYLKNREVALAGTYNRPNPMQRAQGSAPTGNAPAQIKGDADYAALPSGSLFIGPDGKTRRKP